VKSGWAHFSPQECCLPAGRPISDSCRLRYAACWLLQSQHLLAACWCSLMSAWQQMYIYIAVPQTSNCCCCALQGLSEGCLQATWAALAAHVKERVTQGRGVSISGLCKVLVLHGRPSNSKVRRWAGNISSCARKFPFLVAERATYVGDSMSNSSAPCGTCSGLNPNSCANGQAHKHYALLRLHLQAAPGSRQPGGLSVVLSDQLLRQFPDLQLGAGLSHFAAVRDQAQCAENLNFVALSQR
jgi:hypothetical protein